jgi:bacteriocin-like protein
MAKQTATQNLIEPTTGVLPTRFVRPDQAAALTHALNLTEDELQQIAGGLRRAACCKPDGGTCCVNKP